MLNMWKSKTEIVLLETADLMSAVQESVEEQAYSHFLLGV
jgi:hypothetical protein